MSDECDRFGRYLIGAQPSSYATRWYVDSHAKYPDRFAPRSRLDRVLLSMSGWSWLPVRAVDVTSRFLAPGGAVRRKLVLLTALLENAPDSFERYEAPDVSSPGAFLVGLAGRSIFSGIALIVGMTVAVAVWLAGGGRAG